jgi:hypothetical protein
MTCDNNEDRIYQRVAHLLSRPSVPTQRVLWAWIPGSGKTRAMLSLLDAYFEDKRPKVIIVPTQILVRNFYALGRTAPTHPGSPEAARSWGGGRTVTGPCWSRILDRGHRPQTASAPRSGAVARGLAR